MDDDDMFQSKGSNCNRMQLLYHILNVDARRGTLRVYQKWRAIFWRGLETFQVLFVSPGTGHIIISFHASGGSG
jgi:hypothetical protein